MKDYQGYDFTFQKRRTLSEIFTDSFQYFRQNSTSFLTAFAVFVLPVLLLDSTITTVSEINNPGPSDEGFLSSLTPSSPLGFLSNTFGLITTTFLIIIVTGHIHLRKSGEQEITMANYFDLINEYFWRILGISIVVNIATWFSLIGFVIGALIVGVKLALAEITGILEDNRSSEALEWSWNYTKEQWWNTFAVLLAFGIPLFAFSFMILIPQYIVLELLFSTGVISSSIYDIIELIILQTPYFMITFLQLFMLLGLTFFYFDLKERKEGTSIIKKIDDIKPKDASSVS